MPYMLFSQHPIYGAISPIASIHRSTSTAVKMELALFTITSSHLLERCYFPSLPCIGATGLEVFVLKGRMLRLLPGHSGCLVTLNEQAEKGVTARLR